MQTNCQKIQAKTQKYNVFSLNYNLKTRLQTDTATMPKRTKKTAAYKHQDYLNNYKMAAVCIWLDTKFEWWNIINF